MQAWSLATHKCPGFALSTRAARSGPRAAVPAAHPPCTGRERSCIRRGHRPKRLNSDTRPKANPVHHVDMLVTVVGGSGFLGRHVVRALAKSHYRIRVAVRRPELAGYLQPLGRVGQIHAVQANVRHTASVEAAVRDADIVVNLV